MSDGGLRFTKDEMNELINALEEALYLLDPTEEDIEKKAGMYRVMTARWKLKEKNRSSASKREWVGLTREEEAVIIEQWHMDEGKPAQLCRMIQAKLKEKNT